MTLLQPELFTIRAIKGLAAEGEEQEVLRDICQGFRDGEKEDSVTKAITELRQGHLHSIHAAKWSE